MQQGSLIRSGRKRGPDVWQFRWADRGPYGKRIYRKRVIGTACQYPDADSARKAVTGLLIEVNANVLQRCRLPVTVSEACNHFIQREMAKDDSWRSYSTKMAYTTYMHRWVIPRWGQMCLSEVRTTEVESWLRSLPRRRAAVQKSDVFSRFFSITHAAMNCSTATLFVWFDKAQNAGPRRVSWRLLK